MSGVFIVSAANRAAANTAAGEQMFVRGVPESAPTHYVAGWANIPAGKRAAILAAGAVEHDSFDDALAANGIASEKTIRDKIVKALTTNANYLAIGTPTNAQVAAQVNRLTRECSAIIRLLSDLTDDASDT